MRRRRKNQADLFAGLQIPASNGAPIGRESTRLYQAVLLLRIYGAVPVFRVGREHLVDGRQVSTHQLHQFAQATCRRHFGKPEIAPYALVRLGFPPPPAPPA